MLDFIKSLENNKEILQNQIEELIKATPAEKSVVREYLKISDKALNVLNLVFKTEPCAVLLLYPDKYRSEVSSLFENNDYFGENTKDLIKIVNLDCSPSQCKKWLEPLISKKALRLSRVEVMQVLTTNISSKCKEKVCNENIGYFDQKWLHYVNGEKLIKPVKKLDYIKELIKKLSTAENSVFMKRRSDTSAIIRGIHKMNERENKYGNYLNTMIKWAITQNGEGKDGTRRLGKLFNTVELACNVLGENEAASVLYEINTGEKSLSSITEELEENVAKYIKDSYGIECKGALLHIMNKDIASSMVNGRTYSSLFSETEWEKWREDKISNIGDYLIKEDSSPSTIANIGMMPHRTCLNYEDGENKGSLANYIKDGSIKLFCAYRGTELVGRNIARFLKIANKPAVFLEPGYWENADNSITDYVKNKCLENGWDCYQGIKKSQDNGQTVIQLNVYEDAYSDSIIQLPDKMYSTANVIQL